jgi:RNA polymerase sigma-70 factor (ECF subfamily)
LSFRIPTSKFESAVLEHLDAAHNLARWLMRNDQDAQDVVQESCMKAFRAFDSLRGGDFRAWFLAIVRNTSFTWMRRNKSSQGIGDEQSLETGAEIAADCEVFDPQAIAMRAADAEVVRRAIDALPVVLREAVVLRGNGRAELQRDRQDRRCADRHCNVAVGARADAIAGVVDGEFPRAGMMTCEQMRQFLGCVCR